MQRLGRKIGIFGLCAVSVVFSASSLLGAPDSPAEETPESATAGPPESTLDGVFTEEQAARGEQAYMTSCAGCHGPELRSRDPNAPDLRDLFFTINWEGQTVGNKYNRIYTTMPLGAARSLPTQDYIDIVAFILSFNDMPAGEDELPVDQAYLDQILIEAPE